MKWLRKDGGIVEVIQDYTLVGKQFYAVYSRPGQPQRRYESGPLCYNWWTWLDADIYLERHARERGWTQHEL